MFRRGFFVFRILAALLLVALLIGAGFAIFHAGQAQGYAMGSAAAGAGLSAPQQVQPVPPAYPLYPYAMPGFYRPHFFGFGPLFGLLCFGGLAFFFIFIVGGMFRMRAWSHHGQGGAEHVHWANHPHAGAPAEPSQQPPQAPPAPPAGQ